MKGILKLSQLKEPKEGTKAVITVNDFLTTGILMSIYKSSGSCEVLVTPKSSRDFYSGQPLSELQQIDIEYDHTEIISPCRTYKRTLPLLPEDYEKALPLIGKEVEVDIDNYDNSKVTGEYKHIGDWITVAKLIEPSSLPKSHIIEPLPPIRDIKDGSATAAVVCDVHSIMHSQKSAPIMYTEEDMVRQTLYTELQTLLRLRAKLGREQILHKGEWIEIDERRAQIVDELTTRGWYKKK